MENRTFIWGLICMAMAVFCAFTGHWVFCIILVWYGLGRIEASTLPEDFEAEQKFSSLLWAVLKVVFFFFKEKIFRIKPKNK